MVVAGNSRVTKSCKLCPLDCISGCCQKGYNLENREFFSIINRFQAAAYYDVSGEALDLIPTVSYAAGVPTCLIATVTRL